MRLEGLSILAQAAFIRFPNVSAAFESWQLVCAVGLWGNKVDITIWLFNIAMENHHF
jgi:hypothetical protein